MELRTPNATTAEAQLLLYLTYSTSSTLTAKQAQKNRVVFFWLASMDFAEASAVKDMELRSLSREVASLRSAGSGIEGAGGNRAAALEAAVAAAAAEVAAAVGNDEKDKGEGSAMESGGGYEQGEQSFIVISDTEEEEEDDDYDEDEDEDEDDEWLPGECGLG